MLHSNFEITVFDKDSGPLSKRISLKPDGTLKKDALGTMARGRACRMSFTKLEAFAECVGALSPNQAIALGAMRQGLPDDVEITSEAKLKRLNGVVRPDLIARVGRNFIFQKDQPAVALIDYNSKGMPPDVRARLDAAGGFWSALISVMPVLNDTARVVRRSTSAGIYRADTGAQLPESDGQHVFVLAQDGQDIERFLQTLHARCWLAGFGWYMISASGALLERSIVDRTVGKPERLVFEGAPMLEPPLQQDVASRQPKFFDGETLLATERLCPALTHEEGLRYKELLAKAEAALRGDVIVAKALYTAKLYKQAIERGLSEADAEHMSRLQCEAAIGGATV